MENEELPTDSVETELPTPISTPPLKRKFTWQPWALGVAVVLGVGIITSAAYLAGKRQMQIDAPYLTPTPIVSDTPSPTLLPTSSPTPLSGTIIQDSGVVWLATPEKLADLGLFKPYADAPVDITYYKVGTDNGHDVILASVPSDGPGSAMNVILVAKDGGTYDLLVKDSPDGFNATDGTSYLPDVNASVQQNKDKTYNSIVDQPTIAINGVVLTEKPSFSSDVFYSDLLNNQNNRPDQVTVFGETPYGTVEDIRYQLGTSGLFLNQSYVLRRPNNTMAFYQLAPSFVNADSVPAITWTDGTKESSAYHFDDGGKCGSPYYVALVKDSSLTGFHQTGTTSTGEAIYEATDVNSAVLKEVYADNLPDGSYYDTNTGTTITLSVSDYLTKHGMFVYKDKLGRVILFESQVFGLQAECGKPVVYLYPTKKTDVSVKVNADISVSDPSYNNGWNVTAEPNGTLTTGGKTYDSLYWEGTGKEYPPITSGFMVKQADLKATLESHLSQLGLNQKESADFMAFWLPKMPATPYVRLTWFGTSQMDTLAPMTISPKPDSVIRIFLDFQGLEQPISIQSQHLGHIPRNGFTVVEWGGLLRK